MTKGTKRGKEMNRTYARDQQANEQTDKTLFISVVYTFF